jgi:hypothetical protein
METETIRDFSRSLGLSVRDEAVAAMVAERISKDVCDFVLLLNRNGLVERPRMVMKSALAVALKAADLALSED